LVAGGTIHDDDFDAEGRNLGSKLLGVEHAMNGLARRRVGRFEFQPLPRRQATAGAT
jgi:hypothetical protein